MFPVDVQAMHIDLLSCSAHKFHGPRGVGFLYARRGIPLTNIIEGGAQERGKRGGTENTPAIAGMAAALREAVDHMVENTEKGHAPARNAHRRPLDHRARPAQRRPRASACPAR